MSHTAHLARALELCGGDCEHAPFVRDTLRASLTPQNGNGRIRLSWSLAVQVVGWLVAILLAYGAVNVRVAVVETRQTAAEQRLERIEQKIDRLLEQRVAARQ